MIEFGSLEIWESAYKFKREFASNLLIRASRTLVSISVLTFRLLQQQQQHHALCIIMRVQLMSIDHGRPRPCAT